MKFRDLRADEIECRVQSVKKNGLVLLLYKDARVDMNVLDEAVGAERWQREHYECKGNLFCRVGICVETKKGESVFPEWVWKSDCGVESNTEAQKGEASDSFKRACFNWGIGRELYTSPFIWIPIDKCNIEEKQSGNGKPVYACYDKFYVKSIAIQNKQIVALTIYNDTKKCDAFSFGGNKAKPETPKANPTPELTPRQRLIAKLKEKGINATEYAAENGLDKTTTNERYLELLKELEQ